jgi:hypothetical protein
MLFRVELVLTKRCKSFCTCEKALIDVFAHCLRFGLLSRVEERLTNQSSLAAVPCWKDSAHKFASPSGHVISVANVVSFRAIMPVSWAVYSTFPTSTAVRLCLKPPLECEKHHLWLI